MVETMGEGVAKLKAHFAAIYDDFHAMRVAQISKSDKRMMLPLAYSA